MLPSIAPSKYFVPSPPKAVLDMFVLTILFCALVAAVVTLAAPSMAGFARWLLIVESIGLTSVAIGTSLSRVPRLRRFTPAVAHLIIGGVAVPAGYVIGSSFAYALLGEPLPILQPEPRRIVALVGTALAGVLLVYVDAMRHRIHNEAAARMEAQRLATESELRLLRAQLEPHMLFNTLANLRSLVDVDPKLAQQMIDRIITYLRGTLAASREESVPLRQEFAQLDAYLEIMAMRMGPRMTYRLALPKELEDFAVPPMVLQPLVENAIKHGIEPKVGKSTLEVIAARDEGAVLVTVTDTGRGLPPDGDARGGYGVEHVRDRLRAYYGAAATLTLMRNEPEGARAIVRMAR
jgi:nitrate/nitrite-specific signal transduction histidine kinase